mmetsp:Transcript_15346/g.33585  ORF Transcript_15346/g.33585 Transcript_15346/m.33585 type:complete len:299 (-) Transcript_15346:161-1057(-)
MGSWWVSDTSDRNPENMGVWILLVVTLLLLLSGQNITTKISADILEFCEPKGLKDAGKNLWTNIAVVAALMLTLAAAMMQADPMEPAGVTVFDDDPGLLIDLQQTYAAACFLSLALCVMSMTQSVVSLMYVEPLTEINAIKFFLRNPDSLGDPITVLAVATLLMMMGMLIYILGVYGMSVFLSGCAITLVMLIGIGYQVFMNATFDPKRFDYTWTQKPTSEWEPRGKSGTKLTDKKLRESEKIKNLVKKLGKAILDLEAEEKSDQKGKEDGAGDALSQPEVAVPGSSPTNLPHQPHEL